MKIRFHMDRLARTGLMMAMVFFLIPNVSAGDWHELDDLDDTRLGERISEFQEKLNQNPSDFEMLKALGIACHIRATKDAKKYAPRAVEFLSRANEINKKDYVTMGYLGSATTMMAKTTWNPIKKMSYVNKGAALMDKAVKSAPDNVSVRMTRANNSKNLPHFLERGHLVLKDFEHLADVIEKRPDINLSTKRKIYTNLFQLYSKTDDQTRAEKYRRLAAGLKSEK